MMNKAIDIQQKIQKHRQEVLNIRTNLKKDDVSKNQEQIQNMRIHHARAIIDLDQYLKYIEGTNATTEELVTLSTCTSLLHVIHYDIKICEKMTYGKNMNNPTSDYDQTSNHTSNSKGNNYQKISVATHMTQNGTEELDLRGLSTEVNIISRSIGPNNTETYLVTKPSSDPYMRPKNTDTYLVTKASSDPSLTDILDSLETSDIEKLIKTPTKPNKVKQNGGAEQNLSLDKQTIINYWGDWCGYSVKFKPEWDQFVESAKTKYPNLQVLDLHIARGESDLNNLAERVGVNGFPKIVFFSNGKMNNMSCGMKTTQNVFDFVDKYYIK